MRAWRRLGVRASCPGRRRGGLGRIERSQSGSGVGGERLLFRLYLLDCPGLLAPLTNVHIPRVSFLLLDVRAAGGSPAEGRGRRGSGAGLGSAGSRRSRCPEGSGLSSGQGRRPCSSLVRFVCLWPNLGFPSASVPPTPRSAARTLGDPPAFADTRGSGALVPYLSRAPSPAPWIPQPAPPPDGTGQRTDLSFGREAHGTRGVLRSAGVSISSGSLT